MTKWSFKIIQLLNCWSPNKKITHHSHFTPFVSFFWPRSSFRPLLHHWHLLFSQQQIHDFKRGFHARIIWQCSDASWPARQPWFSTRRCRVIFHPIHNHFECMFACLKGFLSESHKGTVAQLDCPVKDWIERDSRLGKYIPELQQDGKHPFPGTLSFPAESFSFFFGGVCSLDVLSGSTPKTKSFSRHAVLDHGIL